MHPTPIESGPMKASERICKAFSEVPYDPDDSAWKAVLDEMDAIEAELLALREGICKAIGVNDPGHRVDLTYGELRSLVEGSE